MIIEGKLKNGFKYKVDDKVFHSYRFIMAVRDSQKPDKSYAFADMVDIMLGEEQRDELLDYIEAKGEDPTIEVISDIVGEITDAMTDEVKN